MAKKGLIYETLNDVKTMDVKKTNDGFMHLSGVFGVCGVRNNNNRVYEMKNYKSMVEGMQKRIEKAPVPGELEHPQSMNMTLENISHRIDSIKIDENGVVSGEITLLNTPKGKIAQAIVEGGLPLFISSRAQGQIDRNGVVTLEKLQTYDLVGSPGFSQAEMHLNENQCYESINESMCFIGTKDDDTQDANTKENNDNNNDMDAETLKAIQEQLAELQSQVEYLTEKNELLQEQLDEKQDFDLKAVADGIQSWIIEEYSPNLQSWIVEEYSQKLQNWIVENYSEEVQKWVVESFAPEVQNWIVEHYSPEVEGWITDQFGQEMKRWVSEDYSGKLESWLNEHYSEEIKNQISESIKESKMNNLQVIDSILESLDQKKIEKPAYGRKSMLTEDVNTPKYIAEMPATARVKYDLASEDVKESISRKARLYDWSKPNAIENFWESVSFDSTPATKNLFEGLDNIKNDRERALRESIRRWRNR